MGWSTRVADARSLPFPAGRFDVAIASYLLHMLAEADVPAARAELSRVLGPGGRLITVTPTIPASGAARSPARALDALAARRPAWAGGLRALDPRPALAQAGFALIAARRSLRGHPSLCVLAGKPGC